jgi:hypothetical protein
LFSPASILHGVAGIFARLATYCVFSLLHAVVERAVE